MESRGLGDVYKRQAIGMAMAMNIPLLFFLGKIEANRWLRWGMQVMALASVPAIIGTYSRGAWLGLVMAILLIVWQSRYRFVMAAMIVPIAIGAIAYAPDRVFSRFDELVNYEEDGSAQQRIWSWRFARKVFAANPVTGAGFEYYGMEATGKYYPELWQRWPGRYWSAHSTWFAILSEHGLLGTITWFGLLLVAIRNALYLRRVGKQDRAPPWAGPVAKMLLGAMGAFIVCGTFYDAAYFDLYYEFVALTIIATSLLRRRMTELSEASTADASSYDRAGSTLAPSSVR